MQWKTFKKLEVIWFAKLLSESLLANFLERRVTHEIVESTTYTVCVWYLGTVLKSDFIMKLKSYEWMSKVWW